ncbi:drug/metabolite transporter (DMT)-like permease [Caldalkalibacillus uzonensis]|uniref:Drug/metabolite transporter (DMT)-like permease n=1 Tax=Caldalkalibacillus uzonensis TaxID=353224 RepID=A0ABU0CY97_9BACI|nr:EamA family transporter [Caldalkalibacillus uzonensis]MDQ0341111.1 drug/metabolite transporter (DMT)-like permease [Caldalkalibacillus uzonensis]
MGFDFYKMNDLSSIIGQLIIVLGGVSFGVANIVIKKKFPKYDILTLTSWQMLFGTLGLIIAALLVDYGKPMEITLVSVVTIAYSGIIGKFYLLSPVVLCFISCKFDQGIGFFVICPGICIVIWLATAG